MAITDPHPAHEDLRCGCCGRTFPADRVTDLDRSIRFYQQLGFDIVERLEDYVVLESGQVELHLNQAGDRTTDEAFIHTTTDPTSLWQRLQDRQAPGVGPVRDQPWAIREFVTTDPDGNRLRIGHPSPWD